MGTWNSISGLFQSGNDFSGGNKKPCFFRLLKKKIRDFNLSFFRKIEPDEMKVFLQLVDRQKLLLNWGSNPCHKSLWCLEGLLQKMLSTTNRKRKSRTEWSILLKSSLQLGTDQALVELSPVSARSRRSRSPRCGRCCCARFCRRGLLVDVVLLDGGRCSDRSDGGCRGC